MVTDPAARSDRADFSAGSPRLTYPVLRLVLAAGAVATAVVLTLALRPYLDATRFALLHLAVLLAAAYGGERAGWLAVVLALLSASIWLFAPTDTLSLDPVELVSLGFSGAVGATIVLLVSSIQRGAARGRVRKAEVERLSRLFDALSQVNQAIVRSETEEALYATVCRVLIERGGFRMSWIGHHDEATHQIVPVAQFGDHDAYLEGIQIFTDDRPEGRGPTGTAFREDRPYICNDIQADPSTVMWRESAAKRGFRASAAVLIHRDGVAVAILNVYASDVNVFQAREVALLEEAAANISFALDRFGAEREREYAEQVAIHERSIVDTVLESAPGAIYLYDHERRFIRWNKSLLTAVGLTDEDMITADPLDFFDEQDGPRVAESIAMVFSQGAATVEAGFRSRDGTSTPYFFTGRRVILDDRPCLVGMGIDISDRVRAEQALREAKAQLEQKVLDRTAELQSALVRAEAADRIKSAFLATMSHELRTPLNSIIGFTGIVLQGLPGPLNAEQSKQLGMVRLSARHLLELINDVLDISKIEAGQLEMRAAPFLLRESVERVVASVRPLADQKGLPISVSVPDALPTLISDRRRVEQILINLLNNAVKFTNDGDIALSVHVGDDVQLANRTPAVRIDIVDTGCGIKAEDLPSLFQSFRQLDSGLARQHEGTGLGLAISRRLAELLGGEITVTSVWGEGSSFSVLLPVDFTS